MNDEQLDLYIKIMDRLTITLNSIQAGEFATKLIVEGLERREHIGCFYKGQSQKSEIILMLETILEAFFYLIDTMDINCIDDDLIEMVGIYDMAHAYITQYLGEQTVFPAI